MIELKNDALLFSFPKVHPDAKLRIDFQRTLRIPDDGEEHYLPPGLGSFPLRHVDDFTRKVPPAWLDHGGVMLPMYQSEAMWLYFNAEYLSDREASYPFAVKIATGKVNAVTAEEWQAGLNRNPQDYVVAPDQPWLDGYAVQKGIVRQFVAMPLGAGYTAEEQIKGAAEYGGLQIQVYPMKREVFEKRFPKVDRAVDFKTHTAAMEAGPLMYDMGLAPGGKMRQEIFEDCFDLEDWDLEHTSRCFVHISNSLVWRAITGEDPPTTPPTAEEYTEAGLPWFDYYSDAAALEGSKKLGGMKSVAEMGKDKGDVPLPENTSVTPGNVVQLRAKLKKGQVREGKF